MKSVAGTAAQAGSAPRNKKLIVFISINIKEGTAHNL